MVAIKRELFGDHENIIRLKVRIKPIIWHKTESKRYTVDFMRILYLLYFSTSFVDKKKKNENNLDTVSNKNIHGKCGLGST
jgi:hypothetical protein